jgi:AcrR family transcriptional regulator
MRAAERLFAEQGIDAVSLRQIGTAAGMRMAGTVAYHFGDKDGLIRAIIEDRDRRIDERRRALLAELERRAREAGYDRVRLYTTEALHEARALYDDAGYHRIDVPAVDDRAADVWLEKRL